MSEHSSTPERLEMQAQVQHDRDALAAAQVALALEAGDVSAVLASLDINPAADAA